MKLLLATLLLLPISAGAQEAKIEIVVSGNEYLRPAIQQIAESLHPPLSDWIIVILNETQHKTWEANLSHPGPAFSLLGTNRTYIRGKYITNTANPDQIRQTLAHELGHLICNCSSEDKAESIARKLLH